MSQSRCVMIGGFLGAGKTTAMVKLAAYLAARGLRAGLITNDQSLGLVDTLRVRGAGLPVREITGGCFCCKFDSLVHAAQQLTRETAPDVLIAEPVGSCTDIKATVCYPLRQLYGEDYAVAPLSVLVDPTRCARVLGLVAGTNFSEKVQYVYRKQLEEAELLVINKVDLLDPPQRRQLADALRREFPQARVLEVSCVSGEGLNAWFDIVCSGALGQRPSMEVDYDVYADGEALLGWLNTTGGVSAPELFEGNTFLNTLAQRLRQQMAELGAEIAHLKMTLVPDEGPDLAAVSLTRTDASPQATHTLKAPLQRGELTLNLRAEADPLHLRQAVEKALAGTGPVQIQLREVHAFRPGRPNPTHRMAAVVPDNTETAS
jgi:Ni2+-binding GTPase involved in maturation of urease and hydrogenase